MEVPRNVRRPRVAENLGLQIEGIARKAGIGADGEPVDLVMHALTRDDLSGVAWLSGLSAG